MRVLFIENAGNQNAGAFHSLVALATLLKEQGTEVFIALPDRADGIDILIEKEIPYLKMRECSYTWMIKKDAGYKEKIKMPFKDIAVRKAANRLAKYVVDNGIEIVHENTSACYIGAYVAKIVKIKHIWHIREFMEEDFNTQIWNRKRALRLMNEANAVIAVSDAIKKKYASELREDILCRIYNGIIVENFYIFDHFILQNMTVNILAVGRMGTGKGQYDLIKAIGMLKSDYHLMPIVRFAGTYDEKAMGECERIASLYGVWNQLEFLGLVKDMKKLYIDTDIFCMCSKCEAFGRVTVEAMLSGDLVIGSNSGGTPEILNYGEFGLLYEPGNAKDLAKQIAYAIQNRDEMQRYASKGREYAKSTFNARNNANDIYKLYNKIIIGKNSNVQC